MAVASRVARACTGFSRAFARALTSACRLGLRLSGVCPRSSQLRIVWTLWHRRHQCISSQLRTACCACCALALSTRACGPCRRCGIECHHFGTGAVHASPATIHFNSGRIIGHRCAHALPPTAANCLRTHSRACAIDHIKRAQQCSMGRRHWLCKNGRRIRKSVIN